MILILSAVSTIGLVITLYFLYTSWQRTKQTRDELQQIREKWLFQKNLGWGMVVISALNLIDSGSPFPFPFVGQLSVYFSVLCIIIGCIFLYRYWKPKVSEYLALAERTKGYLTKVVIMRRLGFSEPLTIRTLRHMIHSGDVLVLNPDKEYLSEMIFLVRSFSGRLERESDKPPAQNSDDDIREQHSHMTERGVDEVNRMILEGTLNLGRSGRPL
ncbi:MAG: hypothetical protein V1645_04400 [archaeon]